MRRSLSAEISERILLKIYVEVESKVPHKVNVYMLKFYQRGFFTVTLFFTVRC